MKAICGRDFNQVKALRRGITLTAGTKPAPRILVVDDEPLIRWSVAETLSAKGMDVSQAQDGAAALALVATAAASFDLVVLDLRLPDVDDLSLLRKIGELSPKSRIVIMTAFGTPEVMVHAFQLGAARYIQKPFALEDLGALVHSLLIDRRSAQ